MATDKICVTRKTTESSMEVRINTNPLSKDYRKNINTPYAFLNHMIEHIAWRAGVNISLSLTLGEYNLSHVVFEDLGMTMGKAFREYIIKNKAFGATGYGDGIGIIDEAMALSAISFEERAMFCIKNDVALPETSEGILSEDLVTFLEGFCQGAMATIHLNIEKGVNAHHIWEAAFRAFGIALGRAIFLDERRKDMTSGVCGSVSYEIKGEEDK